MKDLKRYNNKTKAAFVLLIVMLIILLSNFNTLQNSKKTNDNINAIFNDRLVVARYIFQYANELHSIKAYSVETALNDNLKKQKITAALQNIHNIDRLYLETVLTPKEKTYFRTFQASCSSITKESQNNNWLQTEHYSNQSLVTLNQLSQIQVEEGKTKLSSSNAIHRNNSTLGELQIALLVVLGGFALYFLMAKKTKIKIPESPSLN